jgi:hypothetical protein
MSSNQEKCAVRLLSIVVVCSVLLGCGDSKKSLKTETTTTSEKTSAYDQSLPATKAERSEETTTPSTGTDQAQPTKSDERKIIYTAQVELVTEDFSTAELGIPKLIRTHGGYVSEGEVQRTSGEWRTGRWVARVPVDRFDDFIDALSTLGIPEHRSQKAQEVTEEFVDLQSRIATTRRLEERILKLLEQQSANIEETIRVETELSRIRGEVERMEGRLRYLSDRTAMATVTISAREEQNYTPPDSPQFADRISEGFSDSTASLLETGQDLTVGIVTAAPWLMVGAVLLIPALIIVKRRLRATPRSKPEL